jgi:hypothetical protein
MEVSRYRTGWDAIAKAGSPDSAAGTPGSAASIRPGVNNPETKKEDANWDSCAASQTVDITD